MAVEAYHSRIGSALASRDYTEVEAAWREYASLHPEEQDYLHQVVGQLVRLDKSPLASELCMSLAQTLLDKGDHESALKAALAALKASQRSEGLRELLVLAYSAHHEDNPDLAKFMEKAGLSGDSGSLRQQVDALDRYLTFQEGAYVYHAGGWGFGIVAEFDADEESMIVDFERRKNHRMSLLSATKILQRLAKDHIGVYRNFRRDELDTIIAEDPARVFRIYLNSHGGKATLKQVREELVPAVLQKAEWTRWWGKAKRALLRDPLVKLGKGSSPALELRTAAKTIEQEVVEKMQAHTSGLDKVSIAREYLRSLDLTPELTASLGAEADKCLEGLDTAADPGGPASRLALLYLKADLKGEGAAAELEDAHALLAAADTPDAFLELVRPLELTDRKRSILALVESGASHWANGLVAFLNAGDAEVADTVLDRLRQKRPDLLITCFAQLTANPRENPALFLWYVRGFINGTIPLNLAPGEKKTSVMEKLLTLVDSVGLDHRRVPNDDLKEFLRLVRSFMTSRRLKTFAGFVEETTIDYARFLFSKIQRSRGFTDQTKVALLDVIEDAHPDMHTTKDTGDRDTIQLSDDVVYTTLQGYHKKEAELRYLLGTEIPQNAEDLGRAASFGDISENAEYSAALETQEQLMRRLGELRESLDKARILDPADVTTERVVIGTRVKLKNVSSGQEEAFSILGPWDLDLEQGIISYLSPVGRGLLGKKAGGTATIDLPEGSVDYEVLGIDAAIAVVD